MFRQGVHPVLPTPPPDIRQGIACMILGMALFTLNDALGKWLVASYPVALILAIRSLFALPLLAIPVWRAGLRPVFAVTDPGRHLLRLVFVVVEIGFFYWSVRALPLADVMTIYMAAPLFVTALSVPLLGERVGPRRWAALGVGFVGVMLVLGPTGGTLSLHALAALGGSLSFALMLILTRKLRDAGGLSLITSQTLAVGVPLDRARSGRFRIDRPAGRGGDGRASAGQSLGPDQPGPGRGAVPVHVADLGNSAGLCRVGRCADTGRGARRGPDRGLGPVRVPSRAEGVGHCSGGCSIVQPAQRQQPAGDRIGQPRGIAVDHRHLDADARPFGHDQHPVAFHGIVHPLGDPQHRHAVPAEFIGAEGEAGRDGRGQRPAADQRIGLPPQPGAGGQQEQEGQGEFPAHDVSKTAPNEVRQELRRIKA
jgi:multidrug transporter EmrE-like cation transporter